MYGRMMYICMYCEPSRRPYYRIMIMIMMTIAYEYYIASYVHVY